MSVNIKQVYIIDDDEATTFVAKFQVRMFLNVETNTFANIYDIPKEIEPNSLIILDQNMIGGNGNQWLEQNFEKLMDCTVFFTERNSNFPQICFPLILDTLRRAI